MDLHLLRSVPAFSAVRFPRHPSLTSLRKRRFIVRSSFPFPKEKAKYHKELEAAVDVVERACHLCVDVQRSLYSDEGRIIKKNDRSPVTVADFGVQALISLELSKLFPSIPLVAEEDSGFLHANNLVDPVVCAVSDKLSSDEELLSRADVLEAIDRGCKKDFAFGTKPATYWVEIIYGLQININEILDPIDGTRGFVKGSQALYVVGLSLVVEGEIALGVMGCPNWVVDTSFKSTDVQHYNNSSPGLGIIMVAHVGCGTWTKRLTDTLDGSLKVSSEWTRHFVDACCLVPKARFCIPDSQTWESIPLSILYEARIDDDIGDKEIYLLQACCGSLCKYLMVASGRASVYLQRIRSQKLIRPWDHAAGVICVHEAGGKVTDWKGKALDFAADEVERRIIYPLGGVLVTNYKIHDQILEIISSNSAVA